MIIRIPRTFYLHYSCECSVTASHPPPTKLESEKNSFHGQSQLPTNSTSTEFPSTQNTSSNAMAGAPEASLMAAASESLQKTITESSTERKRSPLTRTEQQQSLLSPTTETPTAEKEISHERRSKHKHKKHSTEKEDTQSQPFGEWDTKRTAQWLSSIGLYDTISEEYGLYLAQCQS